MYEKATRLKPLKKISIAMKKYVCTVCGYVHYGEQPPSVCPVCKQPASKFKEIPNDRADKNKTSWLDKIKNLFK